MAVLDRVKERVETDLSDAELTNLISEAQAEITARYGPVATPITVTRPGGLRMIDVARPLDSTQTVAIIEHIVADPLDVQAAEQVDEWFPNVGDVAVTLAADDYRVWNGGRTLERLFTGTHPRVYWGARADITYTPVSDSNQRDEVTIKLVVLAVRYSGVIETRVGDTQTINGMRSTAGAGSPLIYVDERERLLASLAPRRGMFLR